MLAVPSKHCHLLTDRLVFLLGEKSAQTPKITEEVITIVAPLGILKRYESKSPAQPEATPKTAASRNIFFML